MNPFMRALIDRLAAKGMELDAVASFIGSLANNISFDSHITLEEANRRLRASGWAGIELDEHTFQLAISCFEVEGLTGSKQDSGADTEKYVD